MRLITNTPTGREVMPVNDLGIWLVRSEAEALGNCLQQQLVGDLLRPWQTTDLSPLEQFRRVFPRYRQWLLVMATGIAVRYLDGLLQSKHHDPAVVVLDEAARHAIVLLGGHEAGANRLAYRVANAVGALPVVSTATEAIKPWVLGIGCRKGVSADVIETAVQQALGEAALSYQPQQLCLPRPLGEGWGEGYLKSPHPNPLPDGRGDGGSFGKSDVCKYPCSLGTDRVEDNRLNMVREVATVSVKASEPGLLAFCERHDLPLRIISLAQIAARPWVSKPSAWVKTTLGVDGVCEPAALIASPRGRLIVPKISHAGVAVAVVMDEWEAWA